MWWSGGRSCELDGNGHGWHARPEAGARHERTLSEVGCSALILIDASSSAYHRGMLALGKPLKTRRRPQAILHPAAPVLRWHRPACPHHVPLHLEPGWGDSGSPAHASRPRTFSQNHHALSRGSSSVSNGLFTWDLAGWSLCSRGGSLRAGSCPLHFGAAPSGLRHHMEITSEHETEC